MRNTSTCSLCRKGRLLFEGLVENEYFVAKTDFKDKKEKKIFRRRLQVSFEDFVDEEGSAAAAAGKGHKDDEENNCPPGEQTLQVIVIVCDSTGIEASLLSPPGEITTSAILYYSKDIIL